MFLINIFYILAVNKITQKVSETLPELKIKLRNEEEKKKIKSKEVDEKKFSID